MGSGASSSATTTSVVLDQTLRLKLQKRTQSILKTFSVEFMKIFVQRALDKAKKMNLLPDKSGEPPKISDLFDKKEQIAKECLQFLDLPLKKEKIVKQGLLSLDGNEYYFLAYNQHENYRIDYYLNEEQNVILLQRGVALRSKVEGSIYCAGYKAIFPKQKDSSTAETKAVSFLLIPKKGHFFDFLSSKKRRRNRKANKKPILRLTFNPDVTVDDNEKDPASKTTTWLEVFQSACENAEEIADEEKIIKESFQGAMEKTRKKHKLQAKKNDDQNIQEPEQLTYLIFDALEAEILAHHVNTHLKNDVGNQVKVQILKQAVKILIHSLCISAWENATQAIDEFNQKLEEDFQPVVQVFLTYEKPFKEMIVDRVSGVFQNTLEKKRDEVLGPVLKITAEPILQAFLSIVKNFYQHVHTLEREKILHDAHSLIPSSLPIPSPFAKQSTPLNNATPSASISTPTADQLEEIVDKIMQDAKKIIENVFFAFEAMIGNGTTLKGEEKVDFPTSATIAEENVQKLVSTGTEKVLSLAASAKEKLPSPHALVSFLPGNVNIKEHFEPLLKSIDEKMKLLISQAILLYYQTKEKEQQKQLQEQKEAGKSHAEEEDRLNPIANIISTATAAATTVAATASAVKPFDSPKKIIGEVISPAQQQVIIIFMQSTIFLIQRTLREVFESFLQQTLEDDVLSKCERFLTPIRALFDALPEGKGKAVLQGISGVIDIVSGLLENVVKEMKDVGLLQVSNSFLDGVVLPEMKRIANEFHIQAEFVRD